MKHILFSLIFVLGITGCYAQNVHTRQYHFSYQAVALDSSLDRNIDPNLAKYVADKKSALDKQMNVVIGKSDAVMTSFSPASPLSNFLTDLLLQKSSDVVEDTAFSKIDMSLLNFGGLRAALPAGDITIGDIYAISPFDNYLVFIEVKGAELKKALKHFTDKDNAPYAGAQITYRNGRPIDIRIQGKPIDDNRLYKMVTLNFILEGGDNILKDAQLQKIHFEKVVYSPVIFRDFIIDEIKKMTQQGQTVKGGLDNRVIIKADY